MDSSVDLTDLRIDLQLPAGVVKSAVSFSSGIDTIAAAPFGRTAARGNKDGQRIEHIPSYSGNLLITAVRVFPSGEFTLRMILFDALFGMTLAGKDNSSSDICISFYFDNFWGKKTKRSTCYPILRDKHRDELALSMETKNPFLPETRKLDFGVYFDQPQAVKGLNMILSPDSQPKSR